MSFSSSVGGAADINLTTVDRGRMRGSDKNCCQGNFSCGPRQICGKGSYSRFPKTESTESVKIAAAFCRVAHDT